MANNFEMKIGSRAQVFHGTAEKIVSKKASAAAKKGNGFKALKSGGFVVKKGQAPLLGGCGCK
jgi:hypothetical protein